MQFLDGDVIISDLNISLRRGGGEIPFLNLGSLLNTAQNMGVGGT